MTRATIGSPLRNGATEDGEGFGHFATFGFDQSQEFFGWPWVSIGLSVRVDGFQVEVLGLDLSASDGPAPLAVSATLGGGHGLKQQAEEVLEPVLGEGRFLAGFDVR